MEDWNKISEKMELEAMDYILPLLLVDGFVTVAECELILSTNQLAERRAAMYEIMMSKPLLQAMNIFNKLWKCISLIQKEKCPVVVQNPDVGNADMNPIRKNPLLALNYDVVEHLFSFINLDDTKDCCLVSKEWNSIVQPILRKKTTIKFESDYINCRPSAFLETFENSKDPPFTSFVFTGDTTAWSVAELQNFFDKCGKNIRKLTFTEVLLQDLEQHVTFRSFDLTPWILQMPKLTKLKIDGRLRSTKMILQLQALVDIKFLSLWNCFLEVPEKSNDCRMVPWKITLNDVSFTQNGKVMNNFCLNDYIDFRKATKIKLDDNGDIAIFDMKRQVFKAQQLHLCTYSNMYVENWSDSKGEVFFLFLRACSVMQQSELEIKQLLFANSTIDLSALPQTIEKIHFFKVVEFICQKRVNLPNLNYLALELSENNSSALACFANCAKLVDLKIHGSSGSRFWTLNVDLIPRSVKNMKIINSTSINLWGNSSINLDTLILECRCNRPFSNAANIIRKITPKVLVLVLRDSSRLDSTDIIRFVLLNPQLEKIIIGSDEGLHLNTFYPRSIFSHFVNKRSNYYQFDTAFGRALTSTEFYSWTELRELDERFYPKDL